MVADKYLSNSGSTISFTSTFSPSSSNQQWSFEFIGYKNFSFELSDTVELPVTSRDKIKGGNLYKSASALEMITYFGTFCDVTDKFTISLIIMGGWLMSLDNAADALSRYVNGKMGDRINDLDFHGLNTAFSGQTYANMNCDYRNIDVNALKEAVLVIAKYKGNTYQIATINEPNYEAYKSISEDWFSAVGNYRTMITADISVFSTSVHVYYQYKFKDYYDWDPFSPDYHDFVGMLGAAAAYNLHYYGVDNYKFYNVVTTTSVSTHYDR